MKHYPLVIAAISNWNGLSIHYKDTPILESCLKSLVKVDYPNIKYVLVDAESRDGSVEYVKKNFPEIFVKRIKDMGTPFSQNEEIKLALDRYPEAEYVLLVTNDINFNERGWLKKMVAAAEKDKSIAMVNCKLKYPNGEVQHGGTELSVIGIRMIKDGKIGNTSRYQKVACSSLIMVRSRALIESGGFDESFGPFSWEDIDLSARMHRRGYKLYYVGNTDISHLETVSTLNKEIKKNWTRDYIEWCMRRNAYAFYLRYAKSMFPAYIITDTISNIVSFGNDRLKVRNNIGYRIRTQLPAIAEAVKMSRKGRIRKFGDTGR